MRLLRALISARKRGFGRFATAFAASRMLASVLVDASKLPCPGRVVRRCPGQPVFIYGDYGSSTTHAARLARVRISILRGAQHLTSNVEL